MADHKDAPKPSANTAGSASSSVSDIEAAIRALQVRLDKPARSEEESEAPTTEARDEKAVGRATRKLKSGKTSIEHGHLGLKVHQVLDSDLDELGRMGRDASLLTASATGLGAFALDVTKDLLLSGGAPPATITLFVGINVMCWIGAVYFGGLAISKWRERSEKIRYIKSRTKFAGDDAEQ